MCGIAGILSCSESLVRESLPLMLPCMRHRGPDDSGLEVLPFGDAFVGLGHRRLSIIDLSPAGHQPMVHPGTGDRFIFNGEVYNFQTLRKDLSEVHFAGHSDTEVMLHLLSRAGPAATARFEGMFTFAFLNRRANRLLIARDSMGIKPLYWAMTKEAIVFASEVRAILASGLVERKIDRGGLASLLAYGAVQQPATLFQGIRSFPPGSQIELKPEDCRLDGWHGHVPMAVASRPSAQHHGHEYMTVPPGELKATPFWRPPRPDRSLDEKRALESLRQVLPQAVAEHLVADVPVGVFLSSGIDSTLVAGLAARHTPHLRSFTVSFTGDAAADESVPAAETAKQLGLRHTNLQVSPAEAQASVEAWLAALDQPSIDGVQVYLICRAVRADGIIVALSGQGGDELFGGYPSFRDVPRLRRMIRRLRLLPAGVRAGLARAISANKPLAVREKLADAVRTSGGIVDLALLRRRAMSDRQLAALGIRADDMGADLASGFLPQAARTLLSDDPADPVWSISLAETLQYQGNMLLRDADTNGMAHSLEIRVPLLDQRVVNLAMSTPGDVRLPPGRPGKHLLRAAFPELLRPDLLSRPKRGFTLPLRQWMAGPLRPRCEAAIATVKQTGVLDPAGVDLIWKGFLAEPQSAIWSRAWTLVVLGDYLQKTKAVA